MNMRVASLLLALATVGLPAASAEAVDLAKDRPVDPQGAGLPDQNPQYCLLAFGPEAKVRVWLVVDGDVLYVDRNGNGDLTEPGKRISPHYAMHNSPKRPDMKLMCEFLRPPSR